MIEMFPFAVGNPGIVVDSADFDGTNDYMTRGAGLTNAADSKSGIFSVWINIDAASGGQFQIFRSATTVGGTDQRIAVLRDLTTDLIRIVADNAAGTLIFQIDSSTPLSDTTSWHHILISWDLATAGARSLYIDDVDSTTEILFTNDTIDYTVADWSFGAIADGSVKADAQFAELYFAPGQYLDFSIVANRRKFISASGKPVHLGTTGSLPTGTAPLIYFHLDDGEAVANFATNRGTGGDFAITGTLATGATSPSD